MEWPKKGLALYIINSMLLAIQYFQYISNVPFMIGFHQNNHEKDFLRCCFYIWLSILSFYGKPSTLLRQWNNKYFDFSTFRECLFEIKQLLIFKNYFITAAKSRVIILCSWKRFISSASILRFIFWKHR